MAISANASFPGITAIISCDGTLTHGISPSVFTIRTIPHTSKIDGVGNLVISFGTDKLTLFDCCLDAATVEVNDSGTEWTINILDRRWKWQYGEIFGWYNRRLSDGKIDKQGEKKPRELAKLLLEAMGESGFDVSQLPDEPRPEVDWRSGQNPAEELARLCGELSCRVVLGIDNKVKIWKLGKGKKLPQGGTVSGGGQGFDTTVPPSALKLRGAPVRFQSKWTLEPIGQETDGSWKAIDDLSYKPAGGWTGRPDDFFFEDIDDTYTVDGVELEAAELARRTVWRTFRLKEQATGGLKPPGYDGPFKITKLAQVVFADSLVETITDAAGRKVPDRPIITGQWYGYGEDDTNVERGSRYRESFSFDASTGIVSFANPVFLLDDDSTVAAPELYLTISYTVTDGDRTPYYFTHERKLKKAKSKTQPRIVSLPEIERTIVQKYKETNKLKGEPADSIKAAQADANFYLDAAEVEYETDVTLTLEYAGFVFIGLDGLTAQVSYRMGNGQPAITVASQGDEHDIYTPGFAERRRIEEEKARGERAKAAENDVRAIGGLLERTPRSFIA